MKRLIIICFALFFMLAGMASASTEFYIVGSFDELPIVINDENLLRNETANYSFYAKSLHGPFTVDTFLSKQPCTHSQIEHLLIDGMHSHNDFHNGETFQEASVGEKLIDGSAIEPGQYNLCLVSSQSTGSRRDSVSLSLDVVNTAPYFKYLTTSYVLVDENETGLKLQNLFEASFDDDGDALSYNLSSSDSSVADCHISSTSSHTLECDTHATGTAWVTLTITDPYGASATESVHITVKDFNDAPSFSNLPSSFSYNVTDGKNVDVIDLASYASDPDGDTLSYTIDTTQTSYQLASCSLQGGSVLNCDFPGNGGVTSLDVRVTDGQASDTESITFFLYNDTYADHAQAVINGPSSGNVGDTLHFDGSGSLGTDGSSIIDYTWSVGSTVLHGSDIDLVFPNSGVYNLSLTVRDRYNDTDSTTHQVTITGSATITVEMPDVVNPDEVVVFNASSSTAPPGASIDSFEWTIRTPSGTVVDVLYGPAPSYTFTATGTYYVTLVITDSYGRTTTKTFTIVIEEEEIQLSDYDPEEGLKMVSYSVRGHDIERVVAGEDLTISVDVKNTADEELENVRLIYSIPEVGVKFKSHGETLDPGQRKVIRINEIVPYYIASGHYYPRITLSDDEIRRVKYGYLEVTE